MNIFFRFLIGAFLIGLIAPATAQLPPVFNTKEVSAARATSLTQKYLTAERIVWVSDSSGKQVQNAESILISVNGQADLNKGNYQTLVSDSISKPGIILDFGKQIQGAGNCNTPEYFTTFGTSPYSFW